LRHQGKIKFKNTAYSGIRLIDEYIQITLALDVRSVISLKAYAEGKESELT
jgi:hypothetical protein